MINKFYLHSAEKCRLQKKEKKILFRQFFISFSKTNKVVNIPVFIHKYIVLCFVDFLFFSIFTICDLFFTPANRSLIRKKKLFSIYIYCYNKSNWCCFKEFLSNYAICQYVFWWHIHLLAWFSIVHFRSLSL